MVKRREPLGSPAPNFKILEMPDIIIKFEGRDTGRKINEQTVYEFDYKIHGDEVELFCMLCDVIHQNPQFLKMIMHAVKFNREHDREDCPDCNPAKKN